MRTSGKSIIISMGLAGKQHQQMATVELSKYSLDFQLKGRQAKLNEILTDRIVIEGKSTANYLLTKIPYLNVFIYIYSWAADKV